MLTVSWLLAWLDLACVPYASPAPQLTLDYTGRNLHLKTTATFTAKPLITAMGVMGAGKVGPARSGGC